MDGVAKIATTLALALVNQQRDAQGPVVLFKPTGRRSPRSVCARVSSRVVWCAVVCEPKKKKRMLLNNRCKCPCSVALLVLGLVCRLAIAYAYPYADDFPYQVHGRPIATVSGGSSSAGVKKLVAGSSQDARGEGGSDARDHRKEHAFDEAGSIGSASDAVRYHQLDNQLDGHRVVDASKGSTVDKVKHLAGENFEADKSHNRKHIKSGFSNSYHKDESGSKSSYYEDSDDHGGKQVYDNRHNLRNDYADKLYSQDRRNDYLRDHYDDRASGSELLGGHQYRRVGALDRGKWFA